MYTTIDVTKAKQVATIQLARPEKHNAFDDKTIAEMTDCFQSLKRDTGIRVVVLSAIGRNFCAGADISWMKRMAEYTEEENRADSLKLAKMLRLLYELPMATIAKIQGSAFGGGVGLVACCDIAVAANNSQFCLSEVRIGLSPATISPYVIEAMGPRQARRYFLTGEKISANRALEIGLIHEVCEPQSLELKTTQLTNHLLAGGPVAIQTSKSLIPLYQELDLDLIGQRTAEIIAKQRVSPEGQKGLMRFLEKKPQNWDEG